MALKSLLFPVGGWKLFTSKLLKQLVFLFLLLLPLHAQAQLRNDTFNPIPDSNIPSTFRSLSQTFWKQETAQREGDRFDSYFVKSGGTHPTSGSLTATIVATVAYTPQRIQETSQSVTYSAVANDVCWLIISSQNTTIAGWTRVGTTAYYYQCKANIELEPALPTNSTWLVRVTIDAIPSIGTVTDRKIRSPYPNSELSAWIQSGCAPIVPSPGSLTFAPFACVGFIADSSPLPHARPIMQSLAAVTVPNSATVWLALHLNTTDTPSGCGGGNWTRVIGAHYLTCASTTEPADPFGGTLVQRVTVAGGVITAVDDWRRPASYAKTRVYDVTDSLYNADPLGITNSTAAFQAAANAHSNRRGRMVIPGGLYLITAKIQLRSFTDILGYGPPRLYDPNYRVTPHRFFEADTVSFVSIENIFFTGNNVSYAGSSGEAVYGDEADGFSNGLGLMIKDTSVVRLTHIRTQHLVESIVLLRVTDGQLQFSTTDQWSGGNTGTGITFAGCTDTHGRNLRISNGSDGAMFILNGTRNTIKGAQVIATDPASGIQVGAGIQGAVESSLEDVTCNNCWIGFAVIEKNRNVRVSNSGCDGCHVGFLTGFFNSTQNDFDVELVGNSVTNATTLVGGAGYPVVGYLLRPNGGANIGNTLRVRGNYFGRSQEGVAVIIGDTAPTSSLFYGLTLIGNTFEANTLFDSVNYNTGADLLNGAKIRGAIISNNTFVSAIRTTTGAQITFTDTHNIVYNNNTHRLGRGDTLISWVQFDSTTQNFSVRGNIFEQVTDAGLYYAILADGTRHIISENIFRNDGRPLLLSTITDSVITNNIATEQSARVFINWTDSTATRTVVANNNSDVIKNVLNAGTWDFFKPSVNQGYWVSVHVETNAQDLASLYFVMLTTDGTIKIQTIQGAAGVTVSANAGFLRLTNTTGSAFDFRAVVLALVQ
jgi:hypothetical protein